MLIAILIALGVSASAILVLLIGLALLKRFKTVTNPAVFKSRVRVTGGQFPGMKATWKKCYGAWVTTVLTTRKGVPLNIADVLPVASLDQMRDATPADDVKGLGESPTVASFTLTTGATIEVAMSAEARPVALAPWPVASSLTSIPLTPSTTG